MVHPYFWIRRNADTFVPLIPVDELPGSIGLRGISTTKHWEDVCRGEMRFLGDHYDHNGQHYVVDFLNPTVDAATSPPKIFRAPDKKDVGPCSVSAKGGIGDPNAGQVQANIDHITAKPGESPEGSQEDSQDSAHYLATGTLGKKVYCTYWIRTGNCNYMQEGCRYKHEIPPDDETRLAIGVRTYPTWPREDPTPPPRPAKAWQGQKAALQQSWRRQDARGTQAEFPGLQKGVDRADVPSTPAPSSTRPQSGPSHPRQSGLKPLRYTTMPKMSQPATTANTVSQQLAHGQASTSGLVSGKGSFQAAAPTAAEPFSRQSAHIASYAPYNQSASTGANAPQSSPSSQPSTSGPAPTMQASNENAQATVPPQSNGNPSRQRANNISHAQINNNGSSNDSLGYQFGQTPRDPKNGQSERFSFGTKGFANTCGPSIETASSSNPPSYVPTHTQFGQSEGARTHYPAASIYNDHPFATSSSTRGNASAITHDDSFTNSSSRVYAPATTNSTAAVPFKNGPSVDHNLHAAVGSDIRTHTPANMNGHSHGKLNNDGSSLFDGNGSIRAQTPASVNGCVFGKSNSRFQNPFSPAPCSPQPFHRRMFCEPGQAEYVANSIEDVQPKPQRTIKKHGNGSAHGKGKLHGGKGFQTGNGLAHGHGHGLTPARPQTEQLLA